MTRALSLLLFAGAFVFGMGAGMAICGGLTHAQNPFMPPVLPFAVAPAPGTIVPAPGTIVPVPFVQQPWPNAYSMLPPVPRAYWQESPCY